MLNFVNNLVPLVSSNISDHLKANEGSILSPVPDSLGLNSDSLNILAKILAPYVMKHMNNNIMGNPESSRRKIRIKYASEKPKESPKMRKKLKSTNESSLDKYAHTAKIDLIEVNCSELESSAHFETDEIVHSINYDISVSSSVSSKCLPDQSMPELGADILTLSTQSNSIKNSISSEGLPPMSNVIDGEEKLNTDFYSEYEEKLSKMPFIHESLEHYERLIVLAETLHELTPIEVIFNVEIFSISYKSFSPVIIDSIRKSCPWYSWVSQEKQLFYEGVFCRLKLLNNGLDYAVKVIQDSLQFATFWFIFHHFDFKPLVERLEKYDCIISTNENSSFGHSLTLCSFKFHYSVDFDLPKSIFLQSGNLDEIEVNVDILSCYRSVIPRAILPVEFHSYISVGFLSYCCNLYSALVFLNPKLIDIKFGIYIALASIIFCENYPELQSIMENKLFS